MLNLTRPYEHFEVSRAALLAGKHVYSEKPLAADLAEGRELVRLAEEKGLLLGGAPDTFLGAGLQSCRRLIDDGYILATMAQNPDVMGYEGVKAAVAALNGENLGGAVTDTGVSVLTK